MAPIPSEVLPYGMAEDVPNVWTGGVSQLRLEALLTHLVLRGKVVGVHLVRVHLPPGGRLGNHIITTQDRGHYYHSDLVVIVSKADNDRR